MIGADPFAAATASDRVTATLALLLGVSLGLFAVRVLGGRLKRQFDAELVEIGQGLAWTVLLLALTATLVVLWGAAGAVGSVLGVADPGPRTGVLLLVTAAVFAGAYTGTRITKEGIEVAFDRRNGLSAHQREIAHHVVQIGVYAVAVIVALALWSVNPGDLLLGAGAIGVILGLAARQTLGAVLAGFVVLFSRPFEIGDCHVEVRF